MRIIEQTVRYDIVQWEYRNMPITFRFWKDGSQIVEIKADKYFARANGYNSIDDMVARIRFNRSSKNWSRQVLPLGRTS